MLVRWILGEVKAFYHQFLDHKVGSTSYSSDSGGRNAAQMDVVIATKSVTVLTEQPEGLATPVAKNNYENVLADLCRLYGKQNYAVMYFDK